ncbi:MAG TPA: AAA family ATPase, partial [bacterium]|nr:AAA family ATPase [bacterium]
MRDLLLKHNKHWSGTGIETGIKREITDLLLAAIDVNHIIAISGARRSGKSYLFRQLLSHLLKNSIPAANILFLNFEDPFFATQANNAEILDKIFTEYKVLKNPEGRTYLFFDEIQNIQNWQLWVRELYDRDDTVKIF